MALRTECSNNEQVVPTCEQLAGRKCVFEEMNAQLAALNA